MLMKPGKKHRQYSYTPRFYNPETRGEDGRKPIHFSRAGVYRKSGRSLIFVLAAIGFIVYILHLLSQIGQ